MWRAPRGARRRARREAQLRGRQGRLAFAYLVLNRDRPVRRDELIEALWAHEGAPPSDTALAPVLSRLRRAIEPAALEGRDTLRLVFPEPVWIDVEVIRDLVAARRPRRRPARPPSSPRRPAPAARRAVDRRPARRRSRSCGSRRWRRVARGGGAGRRAGRARRDRARAVPRVRAGGADRGAVRRGNMAEALRAYDEIRVLLREELGTPPGPSWSRCTSGCSRRAGAAPPSAPRRACSSATPSWPRSPPRWRGWRRRGRRAGLRGPGRIGKTRLLGVLRERARRGGRGGARRARGRARARLRLRRRAPAVRGCRATTRPPPPRAVFGGAAPATACSRCSARCSRHTATLAARRPLVLCIDDLQWSDTASLRFVAYLTRRLAGLPVLVATTIRTGEPDADELLLGEIGQDPATVAVRPRPLTEDGTAGLVPTLLGDADERLRRRLPGGHRRQPAAAAPAADRAGRRARRAGRRTPRRPRDRPARGLAHRAAAARPAARARRRRRPRGRRARRAARAAGDRRAGGRRRGARPRRRSKRSCGRRSCAPTSRSLRAPARARRRLPRAARRAARARARARRAAAGRRSAPARSGSLRS